MNYYKKIEAREEFARFSHLKKLFPESYEINQLCDDLEKLKQTFGECLEQSNGHYSNCDEDQRQEHGDTCGPWTCICIEADSANKFIVRSLKLVCINYDNDY